MACVVSGKMRVRQGQDTVTNLRLARSESAIRQYVIALLIVGIALLIRCCYTHGWPPADRILRCSAGSAGSLVCEVARRDSGGDRRIVDCELRVDALISLFATTTGAASPSNSIIPGLELNRKFKRGFLMCSSKAGSRFARATADWASDWQFPNG